MKKPYEFKVYRISGVANVTVDDAGTEEEAKEFALKNALHFSYNKSDYPYIVLKKEK